MPQCDAYYTHLIFILQLKYFNAYDIIYSMQIPIETINKFHFIRTQAHINCLNYHAGLLGYHFPEHDNDKNSGTMMIAYSYINYASYHPEYNIPEKYCELFRTMSDEHHATQPHHINYYSNASEISNITLIEMICDWFSANFEQRYLTHKDPNDLTVSQWFEKKLRYNDKYKWSQKQLEIIYSTIEFLEMYADYNKILKIWQPLLSM